MQVNLPVNEEDVVRLFLEGLEKPRFLKSSFDSDAEALDLFETQYLLIKIDTMNERIDFPWEAGPRNIGYYCATTTLSDIAAVGGKPLGLVAGWSFPSGMNHQSITKILLGFKRAVRDCHTHLLGGDTNFA